MRSRHCSLNAQERGADAVGFGAQAAELHPGAHHQGVVVKLTPAQAQVEQAQGAHMGGTAA